MARGRADVTHDLPPFGWLAIGADGFLESSETLDGKRRDWAGATDCIFLDGRGTWRQFDGVATSGSVAVRRGKDGRGLSIITIEGVDRVSLGKPQGGSGPGDVRAAITTVAQSPAIAVRAFDQGGRDLGDVAARPLAPGWEIRPPQCTLRLEVHGS